MTESSGTIPNEIGGGFYLIATMLKVELDLPVDITPTMRFEAATLEQIKLAEQAVQNRHLYETDIVVTSRTSSQIAHVFNPIPKDQWRYYVISYTGNNLEASEFMWVANLISPYLISFVSYFTQEPFGRGDMLGSSNDQTGQQSFHYRVLPDYAFHVLTPDAIVELKALYERFKLLDQKRHEGVLRAVRLNWTVQRLSWQTYFPILGLFMIIEMLLTHNPNDKEVGDSLTHQIKTKMAFVSARFKRPLDYSGFGSGTSHDQIWGALYSLRSCIAHGNQVDFGKRPLSILKSIGDASDFLDAATKELSAYAILEPDIVNGLKPI